MSSISSTTNAIVQSQATQRPGHAHGNRNRVASEISSEASAGTISSTDATALTSALDSIDASLKSGSTANGSTSGTSSSATTARLDPSTVKDKIDGLIADQVSSGTLTSDQATTLKSLFAKGDKGDGDAVGSAGGPRPGPPPGPPPSGSDTSDSSSTSSDASASGTTSTASTSDLLASFIKQLQSTQASGTGYASSGSTAARSNASALVLDFQS